MNKVSDKLLKSIKKIQVNKLNKSNLSSKLLVSHVENFTGVFPALCTPFNKLKNEEISWKNLEKNLVRLCSNPFAGFVVHGFYSESQYLTFDEKLHFVQTIRSIAGTKKTLITGASAESLKNTLILCEALKNNGADYALIYPPYFYKRQMTYRALFDYFTKVADKSPIPIILHNLPSVTLIDLPADLCIELAEHPNIVGLKECSHNIPKIAFICEKIHENIGSGHDFSVIAGGASFILDALRVGATGSVSALANILPNEIIQLYNMHALEVNLQNSLKEGKGDYEEVSKNLQSISENAQALQNKLVGPDIVINDVYGVAGLKAVMDEFGYYGGPCRCPLKELDENEINDLKRVFEENGFERRLNAQSANTSPSSSSSSLIDSISTASTATSVYSYSNNFSYP